MRIREKIILCFFILCVAGGLYAKESTVYFTTETDLAKKCIEYIQKESEFIRIASHRLSNSQVILALLQAHKRGASIEIIVDAETVTKNSRLQLLANEGISILVWKSNGKKRDHLHHSFCIFGKDLTWTGSYSFSLQKKFAHKESVVILENEQIAQSFLKEFEALKMSGCSSFAEYVKEME